MRHAARFSQPPRAVQRARLDNLTLVPGSVLAQIARCQELANDLPRGSVLIVLPADNPKQKQALLAVAKLVAQEGHQVRVIPEAEVSRRPALVQPHFPLDV
ncbi:MAG: hypothetical protein NVSMB27_05580 [Ktedonobacteraceae bacterium]